MIHKTACVDPKAKLGKGVCVGPFSVIGPEVEIGDNSHLSSHVVITGHTKVGRHNRFHPFSCIGEAPQDLKYKGEPTRLEIGDYNTFREGATAHCGSVQDKGITTIGNHNLFMANSHVAHDCIFGDHIIMTNGAGCAGHVLVEDFAIFGAGVGVHQFCHIGRHSFLTRGALVSKDVLPYTVVCTDKGVVEGLNLVGLKRRGFTDNDIEAIKKAYKIIYREGLIVADAIKKLELLAFELPVIKPMLDMLIHSKRGIVR